MERFETRRRTDKFLMNRLIFFSLAFLTWIRASLLSAEAARTIETMTTYGQASMQDRIGLSQQVITRTQIEATHAPQLIDVLAQVPGIHVVRTGARGGVASLFIRGAKNSQYILAIDGIPQRDPSLSEGEALLSHISTADVERIEIYKGPQSLLFGSNGLAGVINIVSRRTAGGALTLEAGNLGYRRGEAYLRTQLTDELALKLSASSLAESGESDATEDKGNTEKDPYRQNDASISLIHQTGPWNSSLTLTRNAQRKDLDNFGEEGFVDDPNYESEGSEQGIRGEFSRQIQSGPMTLQYGQQRFIRLYRNAVDVKFPYASRNRYEGLTRFVGLQKQFLWDEHELTLGLQRQEEKAAFEDSFDQVGSVLSKNDSSSAFLIAYAWHWLERGELKFGVRRDQFKLFGHQDTYNISGALFHQGFQTYVHLGEAFKAPTLYQLYSPYGSESLKAESALGLEVGVKSESKGPWFGEMAIFENRYNDLIEYEMTRQTFANLPGHTRIRGLEARTGLSLGAHTIETNTAQLQFETPDNKPLARRPKQTYGLNYSYSENQWQWGVQAQQVGQRVDQGMDLKPYQVVGLQGTYTYQAFRIFTRIENLFARQYEQAVGYGGQGRRWLGGSSWVF